MTDNGSTSRTLQYMVGRLSTASTPQLVKLAKNRLVQKVAVREVKKKLLGALTTPSPQSGFLLSVQEDRVAIGLAIMESIHRGLKGKHLSGVSMP